MSSYAAAKSVLNLAGLHHSLNLVVHLWIFEIHRCTPRTQSSYTKSYRGEHNIHTNATKRHLSKRANFCVAFVLGGASRWGSRGPEHANAHVRVLVVKLRV